MTTVVGDPRSKRVVGEGLSTHRNSLNFLRLVLASIVLVSHAAGLAHFRRAAMVVNGTSAAQLSLYGFFAISGYLTSGPQNLPIPGLTLFFCDIPLFCGSAD